MELQVLLGPPQSFLQIVAGLRRVLGIEFTVVTDQRSTRARGRTCDIDIVVIDDPGFDAAEGIPFDVYSVVVDMGMLKTGLGISTLEPMLVGLAKYLGERLSTDLSCEVRVVSNLAKTIALFDRGREL